MNPIIVAPRPRIPSGQGLRCFNAYASQANSGAVRPVATPGMLAVPAQRAVEPVSSMRAVLAAKYEAVPSYRSRPLPQPPCFFAHTQPTPAPVVADEDCLPPPPVFVAAPELRHPRPQRIINRAQMAADAFAHLEAQVAAAPEPIPEPIPAPCSAPPPYPIARRRLHVDAPSTHSHSAPPFPIPRRRLDLVAADEEPRAVTVTPTRRFIPTHMRRLNCPIDENGREIPVRRWP